MNNDYNIIDDDDDIYINANSSGKEPVNQYSYDNVNYNSNEVINAEYEEPTQPMISNVVEFVSGMYAIVGGVPNIIRRSYRTHVDGSTYDEIYNTINLNTGFSRSNISNLSGAIVKQDVDNTNPIYIPGGFNSKRIIFMLQFKAYNAYNNITTSYYVNGYTDKVDVSYNGNMALDTRFHINEIVEIESGYRKDRYGNPYPYQELRSCDQIITGLFNPRDPRHADHSIRPVDLFQSLRESHVLSQHNINANYGVSDSFVFSSYNKYKRSSRINNNPTDYVGKALVALNDASGDSSVGSQAELYDNAVGRVSETSMNFDPLMGRMGRLADIRRDGFIEYGVLLKAFPKMNDPNAFINSSSNTITEIDSVDLTSRALEVSIGSSLVSAISSVAMKHYLSLLRILVVPLSNRQMYGLKTDRYEVTLMEVRGYLPHKYVMTKFGHFKTELLECVLPSIIPNPNDISVEFELFFNILDKTNINIRINGGDVYPQTYASFCDSLVPPVVTTGPDTLASISNDISMIYNDFYSYNLLK